LFLARRLAVATALALIAWSVMPAADAQAQDAICETAADVAFLPSPMTPWKGAPLRVLVATEKPVRGELSLTAPDGTLAALSSDVQGGPPYYWYVDVASPASGKWHAILRADGCATVTRDIVVGAQKPAGPHSVEGSVWPVHNTWNRTTENLYSAWIAKLFDAPLDAEPAWKAWHEVLRDRSRNMLFDYLGLGEDNVALGLKPDCADFIYFLRAYFAFKLGLPFGYSNCSRGVGGAPPKCYQWFDIFHPDVTRPAPPPEQIAAATAAEPVSETAAQSTQPTFLQMLTHQHMPKPSPQAAPAAAVAVPPPPPRRLGLVPGFGDYLRAVSDVVHSGSVRTAARDDNTDFYTVPLTEAALRPGTVYADPYGHVLMLVRRVPEVDGGAGLFLAVDAEPDGSVTRKRFWRGNFLFVHEPALGSPGFKRFRPIVREPSGLKRLTNAEIAKDSQYGDFSLEQSQMSLEDFYDRMDDVMSPEPLDPVRAMKDAITSLEEQLKTRVTAVENGRKWQLTAHGDATMPDGAAIFETNGAWEDFATPARDFRALIAIDVVRGYPEHVARRMERYAVPAGQTVADVMGELQSTLDSELEARTVTYTRSDGSSWTLTLKDVVDRAANLEMAYNLNDCVELRWGAPEGSEEASTCKRHAPAAQRAKMADDRAWFHERHWPTHAGG
jgi:hypothetical protein